MSSTNKEWPSDPKESAKFWDIANPVIAAIEEIYIIQENPDADHEWKGLPLSEFFSSSKPISEQLSKDSLHDEQSYHGTEPIETLVTIAVQLGIEQGRRLQQSEDSPKPCDNCPYVGANAS